MNLLIRHVRAFLVPALLLAAGLEPLSAQDNTERDALIAATRQGDKLYRQGRYAEAIRAFEKAVALADRVLGANDLTTASLVNNLAAAYKGQGQYAKAEPLYLRSLKIRQARLGNDHPLVALGLNNLGALYRDLAQYAKAEPLYLRSLKIWEAKLGRDHPNVATCLNNLAFLYKDQGRYARAEPLFLRSLKIWEAKLGRDHPNVATCLNNLAMLYQDQARYARAEALFLRSLKIREMRYGKDHPMVAFSLNNLGELYRELGDYSRAEPLLQRTLAIRESRLGKDHPLVAATLSNLGALYKAQGQYAKAEPFLRRCLAIQESKLPKDHPDVAVSLNNLATVYKALRRYARAEPLFVRSLKITESMLGRNHPHVAAMLNNLGALYQERAQYAKAEPLYRRGLTIWESRLGKNHPDVAAMLNNLAILYHEQNQYAAAEPLYRRSLTILECKLGEDHPFVAASLDNLGRLYAAMKRWQGAAGSFERARRGQHGHVTQVLPALGPQEQLRFLHAKVNRFLHLSLSLARQQPRDAGLTQRSATWLVNAKALTQQALAEPLLVSRAGNRSELRGLLRELLETRKHLANLTLTMPQPGQEKQRRARLEALTLKEQQLTKELGQKSGQLLDRRPWLELTAVRKALPADAVLIDIARFSVFNFQAKGTEQRWRAPRYVAWVIPPGGKSAVRLIDLGEAAPIEAAVARLRLGLRQTRRPQRGQGEAVSEKDLVRPGQALARLILRPLLPHIGKSRRWIISPDGSLWLVPWGALPLPDGSYAVEKYTISHVVSGRDVVSPKVDTPRSSQEGRPLVLADPDFDLLPRRAEGDRLLVRGLLPQERLPRFGRLPGTAAEARAIAPLLERFGNDKPQVLTGKAALEQAVKAASRPRVVVLSTHGYFLEDQAEVMAPGETDFTGRGLKLVASGLHRPEGKTAKALENPLLRCGLALAGANRRDKAPEGADDGILTGLEIVGTDLRGTELVVLSACETGLGQIRNGEGVAGLRQAFQLAGAQSVVATLWQIPDRETTSLMSAFFENLATKKGKAEALRLAQLQIIKERRAKGKAAHPFYWAAFTLTGQAQ
jgi:CHAT domain-containing protein/Tfp pilus assembly protein PilF